MLKVLDGPYPGLFLSKPPCFVPQKTSLLWLLHTGWVTRYRLAFICTEAFLYGDGELQRHLHSLLSGSTCGEGRTAFCSSTMVPFHFSTAYHMWSLYTDETGKVTLQLWTETFLGVCAGHCSEQTWKCLSHAIATGLQQWSVHPLKGTRYASQPTLVFFVELLRS